MPPISFGTAKSNREETQESMIPGKFFSFSNFWDFSKFITSFSYQAKKFLINYQYFRDYATFLLKFWHTIKQVLSMTLNWNWNYRFIDITLRQRCSPVNSLRIFRIPFSRNTSGGLLLMALFGACLTKSLDITFENLLDHTRFLQLCTLRN